ncbi:Hypothetical protein HVR_LOCUS1019 [uncultured virus]|nr:Hypothetical protein HVR_LOCUS1019 [uncultured virus]
MGNNLTTHKNATYLSRDGEILTNFNPIHEQVRVSYKGHDIHVDKGMVNILRYF